MTAASAVASAGELDHVQAGELPVAVHVHREGDVSVLCGWRAAAAAHYGPTTADHDDPGRFFT